MLGFLKRNLVQPFLGRRFAQPFWEKMHELCLNGMNIGCASVPEQSGELWVLDFLASEWAGTAVRVFDVGANLGGYANQVLARLQHVELYCFEPSRKTFEGLARNVTPRKGLSLLNFGLSDTAGTLDLFSDAETSGMASVYHRQLEHLNVQMKLQEQITLQTLDGFCQQNAITKIDLLKLDVEGHEFNVLKGASGLLSAAAIDFIQFEFGGTCIDSKVFFRDFFLLLDRDYQIYRILRDGLAHIPVYAEKHEVFMLVNYLAISRRWLESRGKHAPILGHRQRRSL